MALYTAGDARLHCCYTFDLFGVRFDAGLIPEVFAQFGETAFAGKTCWSFSNHDVVRHASRWAKHGISNEALAKQTGALLLSFEGSICLWQGEELGQTDTDLIFEDLTDPQGIAFWPEPVGRDNTRTPMVWDGSAQGGFTSGVPWLPVKVPQLARNVAGQLQVDGSVLEAYRALLAFRRGSAQLRTGRSKFFDLPEPILGFRRGEDLACVFNLSTKPVTVAVRGMTGLVGPSQSAKLSADQLSLGPNGFAYLTCLPDVSMG